jgi:hypothetical protein
MHAAGHRRAMEKASDGSGMPDASAASTISSTSDEGSKR